MEETHDFGWAIQQLKTGKKVARLGWNGRGMWLALMPALTIPAGMVNERTRKHVPSGDLESQPYVVIWTATGKWQPGWHASQMDMLGEDWVEVR